MTKKLSAALTKKAASALARLRPVLIAAAVPAFFAASAGHCAEQGEISSFSRGSVVIRASVAPRTRVSGLSDASFSATRPTSQDACVWTNSATGLYSLAPEGDFALSGADGSTVPLAASWSDASNAEQSLVPGERVGNLAGSACSGSVTNARLTLSAAAGAGTPYTGMLTLVVSPL